MVSLGSLWLPILLSAVLAFFASFVSWGLSGFHKSDYKRLPQEDEFLAVLKKVGPARGEYMFPFCASPDAAKKPETAKKFAEGPVGQITIRPPGMPPMAKMMALTFVFFVVVSVFVAYVGSRALRPGSEYLDVFQVVGTVAILAYSASSIPHTIWFGRPWSSTFKDIVDGVVYGLLTAGVFGWLWP